MCSMSLGGQPEWDRRSQMWILLRLNNAEVRPGFTSKLLKWPRPALGISGLVRPNTCLTASVLVRPAGLDRCSSRSGSFGKGGYSSLGRGTCANRGKRWECCSASSVRRSPPTYKSRSCSWFSGTVKPCPKKTPHSLVHFGFPPLGFFVF